MSTHNGLLVLADISGFTAFVTATELEHAPPIIAALLEAVIERIAPPLTVESVAGDGVFATGVEGTVLPPARLLELMQDAFAAFRAKQRELRLRPRAPTGYPPEPLPLSPFLSSPTASFAPLSSLRGRRPRHAWRKARWSHPRRNGR